MRRNAWAQAGIEAFVANAVGTGIKPQSLSPDERFKASVQALWRDWCEEDEAAGLTDFYGLQALACRAMLEGGECLIRLRPRPPRRWLGGDWRRFGSTPGRSSTCFVSCARGRSAASPGWPAPWSS